MDKAACILDNHANNLKSFNFQNHFYGKETNATDSSYE